MVFTIDSDNNVTAHVKVPDAKEIFANEHGSSPSSAPSDWL